MTATSRTLFAVSEIELTYRHKLRPEDRLKIYDACTAYNLFMTVWDMDKIDLLEQCYLMLLDRNKACMGISHVSTGGMNSCIVDPKIVFGIALKARANSIILAHNHPSGNPDPSQADRILTKQLCEGSRVLSIGFDDHLIVNSRDFTSFANMGYIAI